MWLYFVRGLGFYTLWSDDAQTFMLNYDEQALPLLFPLGSAAPYCVYDSKFVRN